MVNEHESNCTKARGGQPGNLNALKHGHYANLIPPEVAKRQPEILASNLEEEIRILRNTTRRVFELVDQAGDIDKMIKVLGALGLASIRTARLLKAQQELGDGDNALMILSKIFNGIDRHGE